MPEMITTLAVLLAGSGSGVALVTVAVSMMGRLGLKPGSLLSVVVITRLYPATRFPSAQGNGIVYAPVFDANVRSIGRGLVTLTFCAAPGPRLVTVSEYTTRDGACASAGIQRPAIGPGAAGVSWVGEGRGRAARGRYS